MCTTTTSGPATRGTGRQALQGLAPAVRTRQTSVCYIDTTRAHCINTVDLSNMDALDAALHK